MTKFNHIFSLIVISALVLSLTSCLKDNSDDAKPKEPVLITAGMYILNEGNSFSSIDGSLTYLGYPLNEYSTYTVTQNCFQLVNGKSLGSTPNDICLAQGFVIIPVTDDNIVWILNNDLSIKTQLPIIQPRKVVAIGPKIYITSYEGKVYCYDLLTGAIKTSEVIGDCIEDITVCNQYLYVCNTYSVNGSEYTYNTNVVKLDTASLAKVGDVAVVCNPTQIETDGKNVYVLSTGNYVDVHPCLQRIDAADKVSSLCEATGFTVGDGNLYCILAPADGSPCSYWTYNLNTGALSTFTDGADIEYPFGIAYDDVNEIIYISSGYLSEYGFGDYSRNGYIVQYDKSGIAHGLLGVGVVPKVMVANKYWVY